MIHVFYGLSNKLLPVHKGTFVVNRAIAQVGKEAKPVAGMFIDCFCRPGDHSRPFDG
jgi:hypothetical protein